MLRYILYARKSSESEDRQVQSIDDQLRALRDCAKREGLTIVEELTEARSAKDPGARPVFAAMLEKIEKGTADGVLCWSINRLSRNPIDSGRLSWLLQQGVLKSIRTVEREYRPEDNVLLMAVESGVANQYILDLRKAVIRGMEGKAMRGWYPGRPPQGYQLEPETKHVVPREPQFGMLRRAWELLLTGSYNVPQVLDDLRKWGYVCPPDRPLFSVSHLYRIFDNPFYCGSFKFRGCTYHGKHRPMVTRAEFDRAQRLVHGGAPIQPKRHEFPFTGLIRCGTCGCLVTAERKVKHYIGTGRTVVYEYYHCTRRKGRCPEPAVTGSYVESALAKALSRYVIDPEFGEWLLDVIERDIGSQAETDLTVRHGQQKASESIEARLDRLLELRLNGELSEEEYRRHRQRLQEELAKQETEAERVQAQQEALRNAVRFGIVADRRFREDDDKRKRQIARIFATGYVLTQGRLKITVHPILRAIAELEPPKPPSDMVGSGPLRAQNPLRWAWGDRILTLMSGSDLDQWRSLDETLLGATGEKAA
jgi:DNA invertase Pin-like site-specific DNA recombinase